MSETLAIAWPEKEGEYLNVVADSRRWNGFVFRDGDIVVATYGKSGTTLTQHILAQLILGPDPELYGAAEHISPWVDFRLSPRNRETADALTGRRILKTHLARQHLPISPNARYIVVCRDLRDVAWSYHNHLTGLKPDFRPVPGSVATDSGPGVADDVRAYYHAFLDGAGQNQPFWPFMQGWWDVRSLPNVLLMHYADIIADMPREIRRLADFIDTPLDGSKLSAILPLCTLEHMRAISADDPLMKRAFKAGSATFFHKGVNGRWRDALTKAEIDKADAIAETHLTPDCAAWLRAGGPVT
jgi:aryl sulfotransferase